MTIVCLILLEATVFVVFVVFVVIFNVLVHTNFVVGCGHYK